jgi:hypothetical protein
LKGFQLTLGTPRRLLELPADLEEVREDDEPCGGGPREAPEPICFYSPFLDRLEAPRVIVSSKQTCMGGMCRSATTGGLLLHRGGILRIRLSQPQQRHSW